MEQLRAIHQVLYANKSKSFRRNFIDEVDWENKMIAIKGARGVGKTTAILQHIQEKFGNGNEALFVSMDHFQTKQYSIYEIAKYHVQQGGTHLFIDEIHKASDWSIQIKTIADEYSQLFVVFTSSSILEIYQGEADLSRRVVSYTMRGLSFREFLEIETKQKFDLYTFTEIVTNHQAITSDLYAKQFFPLKYFNEYLKIGYYPFFLEGKKAYGQKLNNVMNMTLDVDLVQIKQIEVGNIRKLQKLLYMLAIETPYIINVSKLATAIELSRNTTMAYLYYLQQAELIRLVHNSKNAFKQIAKPEKIYLHNTNLMHCFNGQALQNIGTIRETFFANTVGAEQKIYASDKGDFIVNEKYTIEVGGKNKTFKQIANLPDSLIAMDNIELSEGNKIPLWLFGFMH